MSSGSLHSSVITQYCTCGNNTHFIGYHSTSRCNYSAPKPKVKATCTGNNQIKVAAVVSHFTHLVKSSNDQVKVCGDSVELVSSEEVVDVLHLLDVGEEIPVVDGQVSCQLLRTVLLRERCGGLLILIRQRRLEQWMEGREVGGGGGLGVTVQVWILTTVFSE